MPNHVTNGVTIHSEDSEKLAKFRKKAITEEGFDFNAVIPMPSELNITSGSQTDLGMACYDQEKFDSYSQYPWFAERYPGVTSPEELRKEVEKDENNADALREGKQALENKKLHGYKDWYDWSIHNWGTKWNAYSFDMVAEDANHLHMQFDTAWAPPTPIFEKLEEMGFDVSAVSINEDNGVEPDYYGDPENFYVERTLEFYN